MKPNEVALARFGKNLCDLTNDERRELKRDPRWIQAAYGMDAETFRQTITTAPRDDAQD